VIAVEPARFAKNWEGAWVEVGRIAGCAQGICLAGLALGCAANASSANRIKAREATATSQIRKHVPTLAGLAYGAVQAGRAKVNAGLAAFTRLGKEGCRWAIASTPRVGDKGS
jgi:hypothetical protein